VVNGTKRFITNGTYADTVVFTASCDRSKGVRGISAFIVEKDTPGYSVGKKESKLGNPALERYAAEVNDPVIDQALRWSKAINETVAEMVHDIPPYPFMKESLVKLSEKDLKKVAYNPIEIAKLEFEKGIIPITVKRPLPSSN